MYNVEFRRLGQLFEDGVGISYNTRTAAESTFYDQVMQMWATKRTGVVRLIDVNEETGNYTTVNEFSQLPD